MKSRILILGGGFGGAYAAQKLERAHRRGQVDVTIIDRHNYFVFYPLLIEAGTGSLDPRHSVVSIRAFTGACTFRMGEITDVDLLTQTVSYRLAGTHLEDKIPYDHLVISLGSVTNLPGIPGLREHAFEIKSLADAVALRDHAIRMLEMADATLDPDRQRAMLHFVVVGGNFTGVEVAGEFDLFLRQACKDYPNLNPRDCKVTLVEIAQRILPALDLDLSDYAARKMAQRGIDIRLNTITKRVEPQAVVFDSNERIEAFTTIWCAGIASNPLLKSLPFPADDKGYLLCDPDLRIKGFKNVWAIGDCAVNPDPEGIAYPPTAQHAVRQGAHLARNLLRVSSGQNPTPFSYNSLGSLAALGCRTGVAKISGIKTSGFPAWFLWRTIYLLKMPGLARKIRVALDWSMDLFFRRDFVQLGVHKNSKPLSD